MFEIYPNSSDITMAMRPRLHPLFQKLPEGISEFTFASIYLFRCSHNYRISKLPDGLFAISGSDGGKTFFMLPFGLPQKPLLDDLFERFTAMKAVSASQAKQLLQIGYSVEEDRDNFDYLYLRETLANLSGRSMHKKKNLVNAFLRSHDCQAKPLLDEYIPDALNVLKQWHNEKTGDGDYAATREALENMDQLQLCGGIYYIDKRPAGFTLGEEIALGISFVIHFEKAINIGEYKGIYQFINKQFASMLPPKYTTVNREQDLGDAGLRQAKKSYNPIGFVIKYRAYK